MAANNTVHFVNGITLTAQGIIPMSPAVYLQSAPYAPKESEPPCPLNC